MSGNGRLHPADAYAEAGSGAANILDKQDPLPTARRFVADCFTQGDLSTLVYTGDDVFYRHDGTAYVEYDLAALRAEMYPWLESFDREVKGRDGDIKVERFKPTKRDIENSLDALKAAAYTPLRPPAWLRGGDGLPDPADLIIAPNGIFDLNDAGRGPVMPPNPLLFSTNAIDYCVEPDAVAPETWLRFLDTLWPDDPESVELLQEWCGYCLTRDTRQQKILMIVGPKRSGKGTIARVLRRMIGAHNVCAPTLAGMGTNFGLWSMLDKLLAIISDARLSGRTDQAVVTERLLSISGEDAIDVDRKNMKPVTVRLPTRQMILTNELPRLTDSSGALAGRLLVLKLTESFYGKEDVTLEDRLMREMPGILNWSIAGWRRLRVRQRFIQPATGQSAIDEMNDLASPAGAFVADWCHVDRRLSTPVPELFEAWCVWSKEQGREQCGTVQVFGRDLGAAVAAVGTRQVRTEGGTRVREFCGIGLKSEAKASVAHAKATAMGGAWKDRPYFPG